MATEDRRRVRSVGPKGFARTLYSSGIISWRYFVVWIPSSGRTVRSWSRRRVERPGWGNEAKDEEVVVLVELI